MSLACPVCHTENRDAAMFCRGCTAKLPGFAATGTSATDSMKLLKLPRVAAQSTGPTPGMLPIETRAFWVRFAVLSFVITAAFVGWVAYVTRKPPARTPTAAIAAPAPAPKVVKPIEALDATETIVAPGPARVEPLGPMPMPLPPTVPGATDLVQRVEPPKKPAVVRAAGGADPRQACSHLNFIAAARCEAAQCARAEYTRHPHCDEVRAQTRRDVERRNPTLGF